MRQESLPKARDDIQSSSLPRGLVLLTDSLRGVATPVTETAFAVWRLANGKRSTAQICQQLATTYDCSNIELASDVERTLRQLGSAGLVEWEGVTR